MPLNGLHKLFADDIAIVANREEGLIDMHDKIICMGLRVGLKINAEKTKAMKVSRHNINNNNNLRCEDASYEYADNFAYLRTLITTKNEVGKEIQTRIMKGNRCAAALL